MSERNPLEAPLISESRIYRARLVNKINAWYKGKFANQTGYQKVSVYDLIADFVMDTQPPESKGVVLPPKFDVSNHKKFPTRKELEEYGYHYGFNDAIDIIKRLNPWLKESDEKLSETKKMS
jgi:hypothetical protein